MISDQGIIDFRRDGGFCLVFNSFWERFASDLYLSTVCARTVLF